MRRWQTAVAIFVWIVLLNLGYFLLTRNQHVSTPITAGTTTCHASGALPDHRCTPGVIDTHVTQDNIHSTICVSGYTDTVRPSVSYTEALKVQQIKEYGYSDTNLADYEEDHLIPLELGGHPTDPKNLWPEAKSSATSKDKVENSLHRKVCAGGISLAAAQSAIATNWLTAGP